MRFVPQFWRRLSGIHYKYFGVKNMQKLVFSLLALFLASQTAYAAEASCDTKAAEKKLAGAAKNSFIKKCEKDTKVNAAKADCDAKAAEKKLKGAAKNSFTKKCVTDVSQ
jgi:hypothetical protein